VAGTSARVQQADDWCRIPLRLRPLRPNQFGWLHGELLSMDQRSQHRTIC
jgi:hypothetical protein